MATLQDERIQELKKVLTAFEKNGIQYCLLRNYEFFFGKELIESLDTVIAEKDMQKADTLLRDFGFSKRTQQFSLKHKAYFKLINLEKISFDIQVGGVHWNDMVYLDETMLQRRVKKSFFYIPSDSDTFVMLLTHSMLGKRFFKEKYQQLMKLILEESLDRRWTERELTRIFSKTSARKLLIAVKNNQFEHIPVYRLVLLFMLKKPLRLLIFAKLFFRWLKWKKLFTPAPLISIIGPDGAGKSTMVSSLKEMLIKSGRNVSIIYAGRGRGQILPIRKLGNRYKSSEKKRDRHKTPNIFKRKMLYTLAAPIFTADLFLRYVIKMFPKRMGKNIVITDRYCTDILLMKYVNYSFKKMLFSLFPRPTMTIFLSNTPEMLHQRRPEETIEELKRQLDLFKKIPADIQVKTENIKADNTRVAEEVLKLLMISWD